MICPRCGKANPDSNRFCIACGAALRPEAEQPAPPDPSAKAATRFARDALLAWAMPIPFLLPVPLFWRHRQVSWRLRGIVALVGLLWALVLTLVIERRAPDESLLVSPTERRVQVQMERVAEALERYRAAHGAYPQRFAELTAHGFLDLRAQPFDEPTREPPEPVLPIGRIWPHARPVGGSRNIYYRPEFDSTWSAAAKNGEWLVLCDLVFGPQNPQGRAWETGDTTLGAHILLIRVGGGVERVSQRMIVE